MTEEGIEQAAWSIRDEIDRGVIFDILVEAAGWTEIVTLGERPWEMTQWCQVNLEGNFQSTWGGTRWVFERESDATMFALRWT